MNESTGDIDVLTADELDVVEELSSRNSNVEVSDQKEEVPDQKNDASGPPFKLNFESMSYGIQKKIMEKLTLKDFCNLSRTSHSVRDRCQHSNIRHKITVPELHFMVTEDGDVITFPDPKGKDIVFSSKDLTQLPLELHAETIGIPTLTDANIEYILGKLDECHITGNKLSCSYGSNCTSANLVKLLEATKATRLLLPVVLNQPNEEPANVFEHEKIRECIQVRALNQNIPADDFLKISSRELFLEVMDLPASTLLEFVEGCLSGSRTCEKVRICISLQAAHELRVLVPDVNGAELFYPKTLNNNPSADKLFIYSLPNIDGDQSSLVIDFFAEDYANVMYLNIDPSKLSGSEDGVDITGINNRLLNSKFCDYFHSTW